MHLLCCCCSTGGYEDLRQVPPFGILEPEPMKKDGTPREDGRIEQTACACARKRGCMVAVLAAWMNFWTHLMVGRFPCFFYAFPSLSAHYPQLLT
jgi:hypothetical protein